MNRQSLVSRIGERRLDTRKFECIVPALSTAMVDLIMKRNGWDEDTAITRFMRSEVYDRLQDEETKTWNFSALLLAELFDDEQNGELVWPEVGWWSPRR